MADARVQAGRVAAGERMMNTKYLDSKRTQPIAVNPVIGDQMPSSMSHGVTALLDSGLRYRKMENPHEQALLETTFFTIKSPMREQAEVEELKAKIQKPRTGQRPWVPTQSTNADFARLPKSKKGVQLEKVVPHKSTKDSDVSALGDLLQVVGFKDDARLATPTTTRTGALRSFDSNRHPYAPKPTIRHALHKEPVAQPQASPSGPRETKSSALRRRSFEAPSTKTTAATAVAAATTTMLTKTTETNKTGFNDDDDDDDDDYDEGHKLFKELMAPLNNAHHSSPRRRNNNDGEDGELDEESSAFDPAGSGGGSTSEARRQEDKENGGGGGESVVVDDEEEEEEKEVACRLAVVEEMLDEAAEALGNQADSQHAYDALRLHGPNPRGPSPQPEATASTSLKHMRTLNQLTAERSRLRQKLATLQKDKKRRKGTSSSHAAAGGDKDEGDSSSSGSNSSANWRFGGGGAGGGGSRGVARRAWPSTAEARLEEPMAPLSSPPLSPTLLLNHGKGLSPKAATTMTTTTTVAGLFNGHGGGDRGGGEVVEEEEEEEEEEEGLKAVALSEKQQQQAKEAKKKQPKRIRQSVADRVQHKLKAALFGTNAETFFRRYDKDGSSTLEVDEFKKLIRAGLKVPPSVITDKDLNAFVYALDDDQSGSLSIHELVDFIMEGTATFERGALDDDEQDDEDQEKETRLHRFDNEKLRKASHANLAHEAGAGGASGSAVQKKKSAYSVRGNFPRGSTRPAPQQQQQQQQRRGGGGGGTDDDDDDDEAAAEAELEDAAQAQALAGKDSFKPRVTNPEPFTSMEMDVLLRQHKEEERERKKVLEGEREVAQQQRRTLNAQKAEASESVRRLAQPQNPQSEKEKREKAAVKNSAEFRATPYRAPMGDDWATMSSKGEMLRAQRVAERANKVGLAAQAPGMMARSMVARQEEAARAANKRRSGGSGGGRGLPPRFATSTPVGEVEEGFEVEEERGRRTKMSLTTTLYDDGGGGGGGQRLAQRRRMPSPEQVTTKLKKQQRAWDQKLRASREKLLEEKQEKEAREVESGATEAWAQQLAYIQKRHEASDRKSKERTARKEKARALEVQQDKDKERRSFEKVMSIQISQQPRMTHAAALKVETVRQAQAQQEAFEKREQAREAKRAKRAQKAWHDDVRPHVNAYDAVRMSQPGSSGGGGGGDGWKQKMAQNKAERDAKVSRTRPSLLDRLDYSSARDKAKAKALRAVGGALRDVYASNKDGDDDDGTGWLSAALADDLLDHEEVEFLRLTKPKALSRVQASAGGADLE